MQTPKIPVLKRALQLTATLAIGSLAYSAQAKLMDNGIDSENLGKGDWIWYVSQATNKLGGNVSTVVNIPTLMSYYQTKGIKFIVVKAGEGSTNFPSNSNIQFTQTLVNEAHNKGIKIFGYTRSYGKNVTGEISIVTNTLAKGADGYVIDAEVEWESQNLTGGPAKAIQLCQGIKNAYPNRFLAHAPLPIISLHSSFPYKEFGLYCDAVMPQAYWVDLGKTPTAMVDWMDTEWRNWHNSLTGSDRDAIKPLAPVGQGYGAVTSGQINEYFTALKNDTKAVTIGGYRGCSFWRTDLHTTTMWNEIGANSIGGSAPGDGSIVIDNTAATVTGTWTTASSATDKYGADYRYKGQGTGSAYLQFGANLTAGGYNIFEWHTQGGNRSAGAPHVITYSGGTQTLLVNQQANGGKWNWLGTFNMASGTASHVRITDGFADAGQISIADAIKLVPVVADIIMDNPSATMNGTWTLATSATDKYGADYRYKAPGTGSAYVQYVPNIPVAGYYDLYEWHCQGSNRALSAAHKVFPIVSDPTTATVNQSINGGTWNLVGRYYLPFGTASTIRITDAPTTGSVVIADALKLVFVSQ